MDYDVAVYWFYVTSSVFYMLFLESRKFYIRSNNNKVDYIKTGRRVTEDWCS